MSELTRYEGGSAARQQVVGGTRALKAAVTGVTATPREQQLNQKLQDQLSNRIDTIRRRIGQTDPGNSTPSAIGSRLDIQA